MRVLLPAFSFPSVTHGLASMVAQLWSKTPDGDPPKAPEGPQGPECADLREERAGEADARSLSVNLYKAQDRSRAA